MSDGSSLHEMARIGKHWICNGDKSIVEGRRPNDGKLSSGLRVESSANHADYTSDDDAKHTLD